MIKTINIKNYILIDNLSVDFSDGLNAVTGETGAGKSIIINAIDIAFGAKISSSIIKAGEEKAIIEIFVKSDKPEVQKLLEENAIDVLDEIVISREITKTTSRYRVNGTIVNQFFIKDLRELLLDIHSQHQTYAFLQPKTHIRLLDNYSKDSYGEDLEEYKKLYQEYGYLNKILEEAQKASDFTESQTDFLKFQINEIEEACIENINEEETLQNELNVLENAEKLKELTYGAYWAINGDDGNLLDCISQIKMNVSKAVRLDSSLENTENAIIELFELAKDISSTLRDYSNSVSEDTERLNAVQERIFLLNKLKRKYGGSLEEILNTYEKLTKELNSIEHSTQIIEETKEKISNILKILNKKATVISEKRKEQAGKLSNLIVKELEKLELPKSRFDIKIIPTELCINGSDEVEFYISTNVSQDLSPLAKTASGGELSRVMLAIKTIFANADDIDTVIFDEIDTGISGKASQCVAEEICKLAKYRQIILITHQAVIASKADKYFLVEKEQNKETSLKINILNDSQKISAIAKLASGEETRTSIDFAKELLKKKSN